MRKVDSGEESPKSYSRVNGGSYWVEPRPGFEPGTSALPGRRSIQAELPRPPLDSLVLGGLICLCVFRVSIYVIF